MGAVLHGPYHRYASALGLALIVVHPVGVVIIALRLALIVVHPIGVVTVAGECGNTSRELWLHGIFHNHPFC